MPDPSNIHVNLITPTSVSVELENHDCYETEPFEMFLNGSSLGMQTRNSFSLHGLEPGCDYELRLIKSAINGALARTQFPIRQKTGLTRIRCPSARQTAGR